MAVFKKGRGGEFMTLWSYLKQAMLRHPEQRICEEGATMSFEEMVVFAEVFADNLIRESCCGILCSSEMAAAMALLSCFAAGVTAIPLSVRYGDLHCKKILDMLGPSAVITDMEGELKVLQLSDSPYKPPEEKPALIMCTSGTTGKPKGAMLSQENILTNIQDVAAYLEVDERDTILIARPLYHCAVLTGEFLTALLKGTRICFYSEQFNPKTMLDLISKDKITAFCGTPTLLGMMARFKKIGSPCSLKTICISGECMGAETGRQIAAAFAGADIYHVYGLTEACPRVSYLPPALFLEHPDSVGIPLKSVTLKIIKDDGTPAATGEEGVLWVHGGNVMLGYYNAPEQTAKVLQNGWLCTGDTAVIDAGGLLKIKGRSDDLIIRAGMNIYPQEVEGVLKADPRVRDVLVYGIPSARVGMQIGMKISGTFADVDEVRKLCIDTLPSFQVPAQIELMDELPRGVSGKIVRRATNAGV